MLDVRDFAKDSYHYTYGPHERTLSQSFQEALRLLPRLACLLFDGYEVDLDNFLTGLASDGSNRRPLLLSIKDCSTRLPSSFFKSQSLQSLIYLDASGISGSLQPLLQPNFLSDLRILKLRNREIDDITLSQLAHLFRLRLWSLDVCDNRLTDAALTTLRTACMSSVRYRNEEHYHIEGKVVTCEGYGSTDNGHFMSIQESSWSGSFSHPERYLVDAPTYMAAEGGPHSYQTSRANGHGPICHDSAEHVLRRLSTLENEESLDSVRRCRGLTHLHLSDNGISAVGIEQLLLLSNGQLEHLTCDSIPLFGSQKHYSRYWPKTTMLYGFLGAAYLLRPVFSSNLRSLRLHHSVVTQLPTLKCEGLSTIARLYLSETAVLPRCLMAYPQTFTPDMNPRLTSLILTHLPRRSTGPLIESLFSFLRLLSIQERAIEEAKCLVTSSKAPSFVTGLRHLRLEFEPDPMEEGFSVSEDLDAEELMNTGEKGFSFFENKNLRQNTKQATSKPDTGPRLDPSSTVEPLAEDDAKQDQGIGDEYVNHDEAWNGQQVKYLVWVGNNKSNSNPLLKEYRRLVVEEKLRGQLGPVTPGQVLAGAPNGSFIYHTAWRIAIMPPNLEIPSRDNLSKMMDVLKALKQHRLAAKAKYAELQNCLGKSQTPLGEPHYFWTGNLEVSKEQTLPHVQASHYWR